MSQFAMQKVNIIGLKAQNEAMISDLAYFGTFELSDQSALVQKDEWNELLYMDDPDDQLSTLERMYSDTDSALKVIALYIKSRGLFSSAPSITREELESIGSSPEKYFKLAQKINELAAERISLEASQNALEAENASLFPFAGYEVPLRGAGTKYCKVVLGTLHAGASFDKLKSDVEETAGAAELVLVHRTKELIYITCIYHIDCEDDLFALLKEYNFSKLSHKHNATAAKVIEANDNIIKKNEGKLEEIKKHLEVFAQDSQQLKALYDALSVKLRILISKAKRLDTKSTFLISGYVPKIAVGKLEKILEKYICYSEIREPDEGEEPPVLLDNHSVVKPYETITELYSLPMPGAVDPTFFMAPFFFILFGMMLSDAGYGLLLSVLCGIALKKMQPKGFLKKLLGLMFQCGISTMIFGAVSGGFFGDSIKVVSNLFGKNANFPALFNPLERPIELLVACFLFGLVHIFVGMGISAYSKIKDGKWFDALCDEGFWFILILGLPLMLVYPPVGKWMAIAGAAGIVLTGGRSKKNIVMKLLSGIISLYGITGYLSDVLSYSRIMALGLSTGVVASVVNTLGSMMGNNFFAMIAFLLVFIAGHMLNMAINTLGAFVHSSRLQYVEFFTKFYDSGGRPFEPLKAEPKYFNINLKEEF